MIPLFAHMEGSAEGFGRWWQLLGAFHPLVVHFPIALLLVAALLEVFSVWKTDHAGLRFAIAVNLLLGTLGALIAALLGWIDATQMHFEPDLKPILFWHRWLGTTTALAAIVATFLWFRKTILRTMEASVSYRIVLWSAVFILAITGHLGGLLVYGLDYFSL